MSQYRKDILLLFIGQEVITELKDISNNGKDVEDRGVGDDVVVPDGQQFVKRNVMGPQGDEESSRVMIGKDFAFHHDSG